MNVLIDIGHPAHVHYFKNVAWQLQNSKHSVLFTVKDKEVAVQLLKAYAFKFVVLGKNKKSTLAKIAGLVSYTARLLAVSIRFKPDFLLNATPSSALVAWLLRKYHIALEDTFNMEQIRLYLPFTSMILTGCYPHRSLGKKQYSLPFYQECLYLHPKYFTPDVSIYQDLGQGSEERYAVIRFVSWDATHDVGHKGFSQNNKIKLVESLSKHVRVYISSEGMLSSELSEYAINIKPERMHDALAFAHLYIGESATMASECTCLGTPAIYLDDTGRRYTDDQEKSYGLVFNYSESDADQRKAIDKAVEIAQDSQAKISINEARKKMLQETIDGTAFMVWFMQNYPQSKRFIRESDFHLDAFK